jgi:ATP/maltotriose-dependent transcriptional regulator MalT
VSLVSSAASAVDRVAGCRSALWRIARQDGDTAGVVHTVNALQLLSRDDVVTGQWDEAEELAARSLELCDKYGYRFLKWMAWATQATVAGLRGEVVRCQSLTEALVNWAAPRRAGHPLAAAHHARCLAALGQSDFEGAYRHATALVTPGAPLRGALVPRAALDLVESAVRAGRTDEAAAYVVAIQEADIASVSTRLALLAGGAAALVASDDDAPALFEAAIALPGATRWPFELARLHLLYGERLRRARSTAEARTHIGAALDTFRHLGARPWVDRATSELRAAGIGVVRGHHAFDGTLTAKELEIAKLAATGLTNKGIGERLFLSPRTVSAHLYRIFPKLGITSRAALRDALGDLTGTGSGARALVSALS